MGFPVVHLEKVCLQWERAELDLWVGIPLRRERLSASEFWPGEFHGLYSPWGHRESDTTEGLSLSLHFNDIEVINS